MTPNSMALPPTATLLMASAATLVSESGIFTPAHVATVAAMGARAVLVGESIITSGDIAAQTQALAGVMIAGEP